MLLGDLSLPSTAYIWTKSSHSADGGACIEACLLNAGQVAIHDSKAKNAPGYEPHLEPVIVTGLGDWECLLADVRRHAEPGRYGDLSVDVLTDGDVLFRSELDRTELRYTPREWEAFVSGVRQGELDADKLVRLQAV